MVLSVLLKNASKEFQDADMEVNIALPENRTYPLNLGLFSKINVAESSWGVSAMRRAVDGKWDTLEGKGDGGIQKFNTRVWLPCYCCFVTAIVCCSCHG